MTELNSNNGKTQEERNAGRLQGKINAKLMRAGRPIEEWLSLIEPPAKQKRGRKGEGSLRLKNGTYYWRIIDPATGRQMEGSCRTGDRTLALAVKAEVFTRMYPAKKLDIENRVGAKELFPGRRWLSYDETGEMLGKSAALVEEFVRRGLFPVSVIGGESFIDRQEIDRALVANSRRMA